MTSLDSVLHSLPVAAVVDELVGALNQHHQVVLQAPPGAGKTTAIPPVLLRQPWSRSKGRILMLEPRRLAARNAAQRIATLLGESEPGGTVGYRMRLDSCVGPNTRIEVITEGILVRLLLEDPALSDVDLLIFDECHERNLDAELALTLALQGRELFGDLREAPLKLLLMSATLDAQAIADWLDAPLVTSEGRSHPVSIVYTGSRSQRRELAQRVSNTIFQALREQNGSLLVFLPGVGEIKQVERLLLEALASEEAVIITPLYGDLPLSQQRQAIEPAPAGKRKITLATNIAESSITIEGVDTVIDAGLSRRAVFDNPTATTRLRTLSCSRAAAEQRAGRAGRLGPGVCYRLWSETEHQQLAAFDPPEILQSDLTPLALQLLAWGVDHPSQLTWFTPPAEANWQQALTMLAQLGAVTHGSETHIKLTPVGELLSQLPVHPRLGRMMIEAKRRDVEQLGCHLVALLSERDIASEVGADLHYRLELVSGQRQARAHQKGAIKRLNLQSQRLQRQLMTLGDANDQTPSEIPAEHACAYLLAHAYPDRIAKRARGNRWRLSNGRSAVFHSPDSLQHSQWLVIAKLNNHQGQADDIIRQAVALPEFLLTTLSHLHQTTEVVDWDPKTERFVAQRQVKIGQLIVEAQPLAEVSAEAKQACLLRLVRERGLSLLDWSNDCEQWCRRVALLRQLHHQQSENNPWPDTSESGLLSRADEWLGPFLNDVNRLQDFKRVPLLNPLRSLLPWPLPQQLDDEAPTHYTVPSGSRIAIDYSQSPPVLAVKLQEMFGSRDTPTIANGRQPLVIHLLSPARRPIQITQDLGGFWSNSYGEVRKDMKGRYPKHVWPEDPLGAEPIARTTKRANQ